MFQGKIKFELVLKNKNNFNHMPGGKAVTRYSIPLLLMCNNYFDSI